MDLLKIQYKRNNNSIKGIKPGFVYAITNPAWSDYIKIGCAIDVYDRLNSYQTSSPKRDYKLETYVFVDDRLNFEKMIHNKYECDGEWVKTSRVPVEFSDLFKSRRSKLSDIMTKEIILESSSCTEVMDRCSDFIKFYKYFQLAGNHLLKGLSNKQLNNIEKIIIDEKNWVQVSETLDATIYYLKELNLYGRVYKEKVELEFLENIKV